LEDTRSSQDNGIEKEEYKVYSNETIEKTLLDYLRTFPKTKYSTHKYMEIFEDAVRRIKDDNGVTLTVSLKELEKFDPDFVSMFKENPYKVLEIMERTLREIAEQINPKFYNDRYYIDLLFSPCNHVVSLRKLGAKYLDKIVVVEGIVTSITEPGIKYRKVYVYVPGHESECHAYYPDEGKEFYDKIKIPKLFENCSKYGKMEIDDSQSLKVDWQRAVIQEKPEDVPPGKVPKTIEISLENALVDSIRPGDRVRVLGILKSKNELLTSSKAYSGYYIKVLGVEVLEPSFEDIKLTKEDEEKILELAKDPNIIDRIIKSIAPSVYGNYEVKEGIALALFSAPYKILFDGTTRRGDINVLTIGEPGTAKSILAQAVRTIAPRVVYANGKGSSGVGLTASVVKDPETGIFTLHIGALALADGGVTVIDEIDKMDDDDRTALHETLEQQTVTINKANFNVTLKARTVVIGFGNPKGGRFDPEINVVEQINLPISILSRFDLIFTLKETYDEETKKKFSYMIDTQTTPVDKQRLDYYIKVGVKTKDLIDPDTLKKYIVYARQHIVPIWQDEAKKYLDDFQKRLVDKSNENGVLHDLLTGRQLDSLIRISEAYARMRLSQEVTVEDVKRAINILIKSLKSVGIDIETGEGDINKLMTGVSEDERNIEEKVLGIIDDLMVNGGCAKYSDILTQFEMAMEGKNLDSKTITKMLDKALEDLRKRNYIYEPRNNCYKK